MRFSARASLSPTRLGRIGVGLGVRHLEHCGDAAQHGGPAARFEIFLMLQPRLAEMDLAVDHAGQHVSPVQSIVSPASPATPMPDDPPGVHADIGLLKRPPGVQTVPFFRIRSKVSDMVRSVKNRSP
jgi:hypothetical protein